VLADAADEPAPAGSVERDTVLAVAPPGLLHALKPGPPTVDHRVAGLLVLEHCNVRRVNQEQLSSFLGFLLARCGSIN
jgi:hypothetical protein